MIFFRPRVHLLSGAGGTSDLPWTHRRRIRRSIHPRRFAVRCNSGRPRTNWIL